MASSNLCAYKGYALHGSYINLHNNLPLPSFLPVVGLYIEQICLACLFFMKVSIADSRYFALAQGVLMLVLVVITIWAHVLLNRSFARE